MTSYSGSAMTSPRSYVFDPTEQVRLSLIFENWKAIESKKSPLFSTMVQYSTKSLIPPSLPFVKQYLAASGQTDDDVTKHQKEPIPIGPGGVDSEEKGFTDRHYDRILTSSRPSSAEKSRRQNGVTSAIAPELRLDYLWNGSSVSRGNEYAQKRLFGGRTFRSFDADDVDSFLSTEIDDLFNRSNDRTNCLNDTVSGECSGDIDDDDDDDSDVSAEVLMSITRRKSLRRPLPSYSERMRSNDDSVNDSDIDAMFLGSKGGDVVENGDITFVSLWKDREVTDTRRHATDCVPTYENLICLQRDMNRPLFMYIPEPREADRPTVGDCDVDDLSDLSDVETVSPPADEEDDSVDYVDRATTVDTSVQTDFPPLQPPLPTTVLSPSQTSDGSIHEPKSSSVVTINGSLTESPIFLKTPSTVTVCEGEMVEICCQLTSNIDQCDVHWFRDSVDVHSMEDDDRCVLSRQNNVFTLQMYNTVKQDSGYYMCMAVGTQGQSTHRFLLVVTANKRQDKSAPCLSHPLQENISVVAGEAAELCCHVSSGYPQPQVLWYRDGHRLQDGPEYTISENCGKSRLIIHSTVTERAAGTISQFTVTARNVVGEITSSTMLSVVPSSKLVPDDLKDCLSNGFTKPGDESKKQTTVEQKRDESDLYPDCDHLMRIVQQIVKSRETQRLQQQQQLSKQTTPDDVPPDDPEANAIPADMERDQTNTHLSQPLNLSIADHFSASVGKDVHETATFVEVDDYVDLHLTFQQFNALCEAGVISTADLRQGRVKKSDLETVNRFLREMPVQPLSQNRLSSADDDMTTDIDDGQTSMTVDCGLKRVDSKRYRRDYVINRVPEKAREVQQRTNGERESVKTGSKPIEEKDEISLQRQPLTVSPVSRDAPTFRDGDVIHDAIRQIGGVESNNTDVNNNKPKKISYPKISLPSVKLLAEKFNNNQTSNISRVYSLTGRQRMRNKLMSLPLSSNDRLQSDEGHRDQSRLADAEMTIFRSQAASNDDVLMTSPAFWDNKTGDSKEMRRVRKDFLSLDESALKWSDV